MRTGSGNAGSMAGIQSMTGFGSAENGAFTVEIRSVNHRYQEVYFRTPPSLARYEIPLRKRVKEMFSRGRFDVSVQVNPELSSAVRVNTGFVAGLIDALRGIQRQHSLTGELSIDVIAEFRDIFITGTGEVNEEDLIMVFEKALAVLRDMRGTEGAYLAKDLLAIADRIGSSLEGIAAGTVNLKEKIMDRLTRRFRELLGDSALDQGRIIQEAFMLADRADVTEEITRLRSHLLQFRDILEQGGAVGRKLDFLLQEFFREANTIASKTSEYGIIGAVVDMKNEIEKLRELVQNIQ